MEPIGENVDQCRQRHHSTDEELVRKNQRKHPEVRRKTERVLKQLEERDLLHLQHWRGRCQRAHQRSQRKDCHLRGGAQ